MKIKKDKELMCRNIWGICTENQSYRVIIIKYEVPPTVLKHRVYITFPCTPSEDFLSTTKIQKVFVGAFTTPIFSPTIFLYPISNWKWDAICPQNVELLAET